MKKTAYVIACLTVVLGVAAIAAENAPAPPPAPPAPPAAPASAAPAPAAPAPSPVAPSVERRVRTIPVGPTDWRGAPRRVEGQFQTAAIVPATAKAVSVEIFCDSELLGKKTQTPYLVEFNADALSKGPHTLKAVGLDADGKQVWTASTQIEAGPLTPGAPNAGAAKPNGIRPNPSVAPPGKPEGPSNAVSPAKPVMAPALEAANVALAKNYLSTKYGFSVKYPAAWGTKDKTASMKPSKPGNAWMEFAPADAKSGIVVNVRRTRLSGKSDAESFAKYNSYVSSWERKTVFGAQAFATTSTVSPREVIHRLIVIKDGYAWMLNCIDTSGASVDSSRKVFESMIGSMKILGSANGVSVKEIKKH